MLAAVKTRLGRAIFGATTFLVLIWEVPWIKRAIGALTGIDFLYEKAGWFEQAYRMALNPPPGTALLVVIVGLVLIYWNTKPRETRMSLPVLGMLISVISLAGFGIWFLVKNQSEEPKTQEPNTRQVVIPVPNSSSMLSGRPVSGLEVVQRLERVEKDLAARGSELAATRQELEVTKKALANAQNPAQSPPPPPDRNIAELNGNEKRALVFALNADVRPIAPSVMITRSTVAPYSHDLGTMSNLFEGAGIRAGSGVQSPDGPSQTGLMIGVSDMNAPPLAAQKIKELFARYGISSTYYLLGANSQSQGGFNIFIGSKAW
jgi:hypothetical protein